MPGRRWRRHPHGRGDPGTAVGDLELALPVGSQRADLDGGVIPEIKRVLREEHESPRRERLMRPHLRDEELARDLGVDRSLLVVGELSERVVDDRPERDRLRRERRLALEGYHRTDVRDQPSKSPGRSLDTAGEGAHVVALNRPSDTASVAAVPWIVVIGLNSSCARI